MRLAGRTEQALLFLAQLDGFCRIFQQDVIHAALSMSDGKEAV